MNNIYSEDEIYKIVEDGDSETCNGIFSQLLAGADNGNIDFANIAADWLRYGRYVVDINIEKSQFYLRMAVKELVPDAIYDYGLSLDGDQDEQHMQAFSYFVLAAILGDANAVGAVSDYFLYGTVVDNNDFISGALRKHQNYLRNGRNDDGDDNKL